MKKKNIITPFLIMVAMICAMIPTFLDLRLSYNKDKISKSFEDESPSRINLSTVNLTTEGLLYIPSIKLSLPIFNTHSDDEGESIKMMEVAENNGAALWYMTDRLDGDKRSLLSSHNGLSSSELFTNLDELRHKDKFYIKNKNGKIRAFEIIDIDKTQPNGDLLFRDKLNGEEVYRYTEDGVYKINKDSYEGYKTVFSEKISDVKNNLDIFYETDKKLISLQTCVPIFQNTHRLLVTGIEIPYEGEEFLFVNSFKTFLLIFIGLLLIFLISLIIFIKNLRSNR